MAFDVVTYSLCKKYSNQLAAAGIQSVSYDSTNSQIVVVYGTNPPTTIRYTIPTIKGDPGEDGEDGVGISSAAVTADYHLKLVYTDGTEWTSTESIRGPQGTPAPSYSAGTGISIVNGVISSTAVSFKPMKSAWTSSSLTTSQAASMILADPDVKSGDAFSGGVYWNDLYQAIRLGNGEATARVGDNKSFVLFTMSSSDTEPYEWNWNSYAGEWRSYVPIVNDTLSDSTYAALSANMGKNLQDQITNLKNMGRFLSIWNCATGLPTTNPETMPYTYKTGDYYRVGTVGTTNYKPNGSTYNGTASTTVDTGDVEVGAVYYYDGTNWVMQGAGSGGVVRDIQVNGTTVLNTTTGIANVPATSLQAFGAIKAGTISAADFIALAAKDPDTYYFIEY